MEETKMRYISNTFGEKLLVKGTIISKVFKQTDNGFVEMFVAEWTNGVRFIVMRAYGNVVKVSGL